MKASRSKFISHILILLSLLGVLFSIQPATPARALFANVPGLTPTWNTFLGGSGQDYGSAIAKDGNGNIFIAGTSVTTPWGSPIRPHSSGSDAFVAKLDASGNLIWNTFLGGTGDDSSSAIAVDDNGNIYVVGTSITTWGNPIRAHSAGSDAFVVKLNTSGNVVWSTFLGGSGADYGYSIAVNGGNVFVAGSSNATWGNPSRPYSANDDGFAVKLDASTGSLGWNSFLGGTGSDHSADIAVNSSGYVFLIGPSQTSWGNPVVAISGSHGCFAAKLNASTGTLSWNTFLSGAAVDFCTATAVDNTGNMFMLIDASNSPDDTLVVKVDFVTGDVNWATYLGGYGDPVSGSDITVDNQGSVFVTGSSADTWGEPVQPHNAGDDAFAAKLNALDGGTLWNTFLGGNGGDSGDSIIVDHSGNVFVAGISDATWGSPKRPYTANFDIFVHKVGLDITPPTVLSIERASQNPSNAATVEFTITFSEPILGAYAYGKDFDLTTTGVTGASVTGVVNSLGATRTVIVNTGSGNGTIRLNVKPSGTDIIDVASNPLNGGFTNGQTYTINKQPVTTVALPSIATHDGWVLESTETSDMGSTMYRTGPALLVGDDADKKQYRSILSFDTSSLPDTAVITDATLKVKKNGFIGGTDQITVFQGFMVDIKTGFFSDLPTLQALDFQAAADKTFGPASPVLSGGFYNFGLVNGVNYINKLSTNGGLTQMRLRFKLDDNNDAVANYLSLFSGEAANTADRPQLVVTYYVP